MMFVFHVDQGRMLTFKMECMFEDIRKLKEVIERNHAIPARSIVLLVSGGELLEDDSRASKYATGTDTNPVYMFSKNLDDSPLPSPAPIKETEVDLEGLVKKSLELPVSYSTVASRAQLAQKICDMGKEELRRCETLIHEQHLQQQGWAAVVANMEDTVKEFQERCEYFNRYYEDQLRLHADQMDVIQNFDQSLQQLANIPILSSLMENAELRPYGMFDEVFNPSVSTNSAGSRTTSNNEQSQMRSGEGSSNAAASVTGPSAVPGDERSAVSESSQPPEQQHPTDEVEGGPEPVTIVTGDEVALTDTERAKGISLLDWISAMEGQVTLKRMAEECRINIEKFNRDLLTNMNERIDKAVKVAQSVEVKVVKGLEERLCGLESLLAETKVVVQDQIELAQSIQMNQTRANTLGDTSILPDLCSMHRNHLLLMQNNHVKLLGYRRRCKLAKDELGVNLTRRLKYIMNVETRVHELDSRLQLYHTSLQRLQKHLSIIEQIHMVPRMYVSAVTEVVRRRMFSSAFLRWASDLACRLMAIHNEEMVRRQEFTEMFEGHFLSTLFPGMSDVPPSYAIQAPSVFDSSLPALDKQDLEELSRYLPELTERIPLPNIASVIDFFQTRSVEQQLLQNRSSSGDKDDASVSVRSKDNATASSSEHTGPSSVPGPTGAKESDKIGAESETDTEEYEKVQNQSPIEGRSQQGELPRDGDQAKPPAAMTCSVATLTEPVETVCAETLTEVRFSDTISPTTAVRTAATGTNTTNTASCNGTNTLTASTNNAPGSTVAMSAHGETGGQCGTWSDSAEQPTTLSGYHPAIPEDHPPSGIAAGVAGHEGRCPQFIPSSFESGRRLRRGIFTRTSSSERSSSSQELLLLALMEPGTGNVVLRSPGAGDEGEFINSEFYIDESLPSSAASVERRQQLEHHQHQPPYQQPSQPQDVRQSLADCLLARGRSSYDEGTVILLLQDNLGTTRLEVERLKGLLRSVYQLSQDSILMLRDQLGRVRRETETNRAEFQSELGAMNRAWNDIQQLARNRERETIQQLTVDHELEMNDLRKSIHLKDDELQSLRTMKASHVDTVWSYEQEKKELSEQITQMRAVIDRLERQLADAEVDRTKAIQEAVEQLEHKHRTEIDALRCRFKLATSMDRSPSDTSLEKIEKPDMIDIGTHEQMMAQIREELQREKERAVRTAIEEERQRWERNAGVEIGSAGSAGSANRLHRSYGAAGSPGGSGSQDVYKRILDEKDRQLDELRDKEAQLSREVMRMRETIESLTDPELSPLNDQNLREQLEAVEVDRQLMAERLTKLRGNVEALEHEKHSLTRKLERHRKDAAQLHSCAEGDLVMFVWNPAHGQYTIVQMAEYMYFMHETTYQELGLQPSVYGVVPQVLSGFGTVVMKEFCHARRDDNRYRVPRGTCFYRVRLKPAPVKGRHSSCGSEDSLNATQKPASAVVTIEVQPSGSTSSGRLTDSIAQRELPVATSPTTSATAILIGTPTGDGSKSPTAGSRDMIDSGVVEQQRSSYRERNVSITDEDDIMPGIGSTGSIDRIRYQSVCEEEDPAAEDDTDGDRLEDSTGVSNATLDHLSCYTSATDTSIVAIRTPTLLIAGSPMEGSSVAGDTSTASNVHPLSATNTQQPAPQSSLLPIGGGAGFSSIGDDVSDSADSEYRSLEGSDSVAIPMPLGQDDEDH